MTLNELIKYYKDNNIHPDTPIALRSLDVDGNARYEPVQSAEHGYFSEGKRGYYYPQFKSKAYTDSSSKFVIVHPY